MYHWYAATDPRGVCPFWVSGMKGGSTREQQFEMIKVNGKWQIAKIVCE